MIIVTCCNGSKVRQEIRHKKDGEPNNRTHRQQIIKSIDDISSPGTLMPLSVASARRFLHRLFLPASEPLSHTA